jgi:hypothetical protein
MACFTILYFNACKKDFLDKRPDKALLVPTTLDDLDKILNNDQVMTFAPEINLIASDEYTITAQGLQTISSLERNSYLWANDIYEGRSVADWGYSYTQVYYANVVLQGLEQIKPDDATKARYSQIKGSALFYRAMAFYNLAQLFCKPFDQASGGQDEGIPLRLDPDINKKSTRASVKETYAQIIADLTFAETLVPSKQVIYKNIGQPAVRALLARVYLSMADYDKAAFYSDACLKTNSELIDYNDLLLDDYRPFPAAPAINKEMLAYYQLGPYAFDYTAFVDPAVYNSYTNDDLRKGIFFSNNGDGTFAFKGTYGGGSTLFGGLATDEMYLIRAEANARLGNLTSATDDLNALLVKRWKKGTYISFGSTVQQEVLNKILTERKKELLSRGLRWTDLRRLNSDPRFAVTLTRNIDGQTISLKPNDLKYVFPIPDDEIRGSGIPQNPR